MTADASTDEMQPTNRIYSFAFVDAGTGWGVPTVRIEEALCAALEGRTDLARVRDVVEGTLIPYARARGRWSIHERDLEAVIKREKRLGRLYWWTRMALCAVLEGHEVHFWADGPEARSAAR